MEFILPLLTSAVVNIFTYGPSGSGKTYTAGINDKGVDITEETGIIKRLLFYLFQKRSDNEFISISIKFINF